MNLDYELVGKARDAAGEIARGVQTYIERHTTISVERSVLRLLGVDDIDADGVPYPNIVVDQLKVRKGLPLGAATYIGNATDHLRKSPQEIARMVARGDLCLTAIPLHQPQDVQKIVAETAQASVDKILANRKWREEFISHHGDKEGQLLYVIVATGNIFEDITQAKAAAHQGADVIAVIRTTGQSLLDYVPYGATTEGFGGTYATQENFRLMRTALDEESQKLGRYIRLCNDWVLACACPSIAAMGALERLDVMLNDALYGILFRDINMKRTMIDQYFSRMINGYAGVIINTGEDNYLTTADAFEEADTGAGLAVHQRTAGPFSRAEGRTNGIGTCL